ncbi:MAG: hypothetical protein H6835_07000 [Planctomycetes bacterium]|nr:hypothetical protein [Planctomycetota bacterium]
MPKLVLPLAVVSLVTACTTPPPEPWLRAELTGRTSLTERGPGSYGGQLCGADVTVDLYEQEVFVKVQVDNHGASPVTVHVGRNGGVNLGTIGQVLLRRLDGSIGGPDMMPYGSLQPQVVEPGWRATFYIDQPLGREPKLGQYFVMSLEGEPASSGEVAGDARERHLLPLIVRQGGTRTPRAR